MKPGLVAVAFGTLLFISACGDGTVSTEASNDVAPTNQSTDMGEETAATSSVPQVEEEEVEDTLPPLPSTTEPPSGVVVKAQCPGDALCAEAFVLNGLTYERSCTGVLEEAVLFDTVLGSGTAFFQQVEVFALNGQPDARIVAIDIPSGCTEDPTEEISPWTFAWVNSAGVVPVVCELGLLSPEQREVNDC